MSWNKCTINSELDQIIEILLKFDIPYNYDILGYVKGYGLNDDCEGIDYEYSIRKISTSKVILIEQMQRTCDCDTDDIIKLFWFKPEDEPKEWKTEIMICVCGGWHNDN